MASVGNGTIPKPVASARSNNVRWRIVKRRCNTLRTFLRVSKIILQRILFHLYSIFLFTFSDLKTIVIPSSIFGLMSALALTIENSQLSRSPPLRLPSAHEVLLRTPWVVLWVWANLLPFDIGNQTQPGSIKEDKLNKPWRPIPTERISDEAARTLMIPCYGAAIALSFHLDNWLQCFTLILLGYWYNDLRGADRSCIVRNFINACGYICFTSGAMQAAIHFTAEEEESESALLVLGWWHWTIAFIIFSTVHAQDMSDQRGDRLKKRKTLPLVIGDEKARRMIAVSVAVWSFQAPNLWNSPWEGYEICVGLGLAIVVRTLRYRTREDDETTFRIWNAWIGAIYLLPLIKVLSTNGGESAFKATKTVSSFNFMDDLKDRIWYVEGDTIYILGR